MMFSIYSILTIFCSVRKYRRSFFFFMTKFWIVLQTPGTSTWELCSSYCTSTGSETRKSSLSWPHWNSHTVRLLPLAGLFSKPGSHWLCHFRKKTPPPHGILKGTVLWDRFQKVWQKFTKLGLTKGRGWFLNFLGAPMILKHKKYIYCG